MDFPIKFAVDSLAEFTLSDDHKEVLRGLARTSITHGVRFGQPLSVNPRQYPAPLPKPKGVFITLRVAGHLRGCLGTLEATEPLVAAVPKYAFASAFKDPRFEKVAEAELDELHIQISVLSEPEPIPFNSENELLALLRPGIDGLVLVDGRCHGTLLPSVWEEIPDRRQFVARLKQKAGLPPYYWSGSIKVKRYTTLCF